MLIQAPNDEPASILLERIRAEKEELIEQGKIKRDKKESVIFRGDDNSSYKFITRIKEIAAYLMLLNRQAVEKEGMIFSHGYYPIELFFGGEEVSDMSASLIIAQMLFLEAQDPEKDIQLYINSPGGSVSAGFAIYNKIEPINYIISHRFIGSASVRLALS